MGYIKEVFKASNLPSWISLVAVIAVLLTLNQELSRSEIESEKDKIITQFSESTLPIQIADVRGKPKKLQALSELVSDRLVIPTALGYEPNRFTPRLFDDIGISLNLAIHKYQSDVNDEVYIPRPCSKTRLLVDDVNSMVIRLERLRGGFVDSNFQEYIDSHRDIVLKKLVLATKRKTDDFDFVMKCFKERLT